jgi:RimJ/RimL family protein N-acetyltransferase
LIPNRDNPPTIVIDRLSFVGFQPSKTTIHSLSALGRLGQGMRFRTVGRMGHPYWPLFDLDLRTPNLHLRPISEADLVTIAGILPPDLELEPAATRYDVGDEHVSRGIVACQRYWRAFGTWNPEAWHLSFAVFDGLEMIGVQELESHDFPTLRTVDSASWLVSGVRGRGYGKQMRTAVLALAFGPLGAREAITSAWHDNHASLAVSRALGYRDNGLSLHRRDDSVDVMTHLRLTRDDWLIRTADSDVRIAGFDPCRALFGL